MPPRGSGNKRVKPEQAVAAGAAAAAAAADSPVALRPEALDTKEYSINADHYAAVQEALTVIENTPGMENLRTAEPLKLVEGGSIAPFDQTVLKEKIDKGECYTCGATIYFANPLRDASPGVPLDSAKIHDYMIHNYHDVDSILRLPAIEICCDGEGVT